MFDINAARKAGYSNEEITSFLAKEHPEFDVASAVKAGYTPEEIVAHLTPTAEPSLIDKAAGGVARLIMDGGPGGVLGDAVKAGYAGLADIDQRKGIEQAGVDTRKVLAGETPDTDAAKAGSDFGSKFTPAQVALMTVGEDIASIVGPWAANLLNGWGKQAALNAVGFIKSMAEKFGLENLSDLSDFLLKPVQLGAKKFAPIITAFSDKNAMLDSAKLIQDAAAKLLGASAKAVDESLPAGIPTNGGTAQPAFDVMDLPSLQKAVEAFRDEFNRVIPNLGKDVIEKYNLALKDIDALISRAITEGPSKMFSDLSAAKTAIGKLAFEHSSKMESTAALQQVYWAANATLKNATRLLDETTSGHVGADWDAANLVYHRVTAVIDALEGRATKFAVKDLFAPGSFGALGAYVGGHVGGAMGIVPGTIVGAMTGAATQAYGHQMAAKGLTSAAPYIARGVEALPVVGKSAKAAIDVLRGE